MRMLSIANVSDTNYCCAIASINTDCMRVTISRVRISKHHFKRDSIASSTYSSASACNIANGRPILVTFTAAVTARVIRP
jgi:hypothetical protein